MKRTPQLFLLTLVLCGAVTAARPPLADTSIHLTNSKIDIAITIAADTVASVRTNISPSWAAGGGSWTTDADFGIEIMWTDWQAPKTVNNAENPILLTKSDFHVTAWKVTEEDGGMRMARIDLDGNDIPLSVRLTYELGKDNFYLRKQVCVTDTSNAGHFLQKLWTAREVVSGEWTLVKEGGFGQPVALQNGTCGMFAGLEIPTSDNTIQKAGVGWRMRCGQEIGERITASGIAGEFVVEGITPDPYVKQWFMKYVDAIRVAPLRPYTLYNSWYDLRSTEYPRVPDENKMNEKNILRIVGLIRKNMIEKHHIDLDAFVLDDGWDTYQSDWLLRKEEFPHGLAPISEELAKTGTTLGMWFGPTGGYSFRMKRITWMKDHGYEVVGHTPNTTMLCLGGTHYSELFRRRTTDFVKNAGVGYFKWDGIQFSCSEPDHGHPVGIYSRRAVMESVIDACTAVRTINPKVFLNITSGTWLSPWWVKYANQIWMQGEDYGYADVPSISPRDAAITYRDLSLYEDFRKNDFWMPIQNLMTHGIIKGTLEKLGGEEEPLDKFTNEVVLYLARGVSMWELYISPDILTDGEWNALGEAMHWAKDRFPVLSTTEMIGGDPKKRETYGYVHFAGNRGIIAARNPWIEAGRLAAALSPAFGLDRKAGDLVLERVYPTRWISPKLYRAGDVVDLRLDGYETAIYEVYPRSDVRRPLLAGVPFSVSGSGGKTYTLSLLPAASDVTFLTEQKAGISVDGKPVTTGELEELLHRGSTEEAFADEHFTADPGGFSSSFLLRQSVRTAQLAMLASPSAGVKQGAFPRLRVNVDGKEDTAVFHRGEGSSAWFTCNLAPGTHKVRVTVEPRTGSWTGTIGAWMVLEDRRPTVDVTIASDEGAAEPPMPPLPFPPGVVPVIRHLGETTVSPVSH